MSRCYARTPKNEKPRSRGTYRLTDKNIEFIRSVAEEKGLSLNAALNLSLSALRQARSEKKHD